MPAWLGMVSGYTRFQIFAGLSPGCLRRYFFSSARAFVTLGIPGLPRRRALGSSRDRRNRVTRSLSLGSALNCWPCCRFSPRAKRVTSLRTAAGRRDVDGRRGLRFRWGLSWRPSVSACIWASSSAKRGARDSGIASGTVLLVCSVMDSNRDDSRFHHERVTVT